MGSVGKSSRAAPRDRTSDIYTLRRIVPKDRGKAGTDTYDRYASGRSHRLRIGRKKRTASLNSEQLVVCCDTNLPRQKSSRKIRVSVTADYREAIRNNNVDLVMVATINAALAKFLAWRSMRVSMCRGKACRNLILRAARAG